LTFGNSETSVRVGTDGRIKERNGLDSVKENPRRKKEKTGQVEK